MPWRLMLALLFMTAAVGPAPAHNLQAGGLPTETQERMADQDNNDLIWNLIGLLGLIGLIGPERAPVRTDQNRYRRFRGFHSPRGRPLGGECGQCEQVDHNGGHHCQIRPFGGHQAFPSFASVSGWSAGSTRLRACANSGIRRKPQSVRHQEQLLMQAAPTLGAVQPGHLDGVARGPHPDPARPDEQ